MKLAVEYIKMAIKRNLQYKLNFVLLCVAVAPIHLTQLFFSWVITEKFKIVDGWNFKELALLYGMMLTAYSIAQILFRQFRFLDRYIIQGKLDNFFLRPQGMVYSIVFSEINIMEIVSQLFPSIIVLIYALGVSRIQWNFIKIAICVGGVVGGTLILVCIFVIFGATAFWTQKLGQFVAIFFTFKDYLNYPITIYTKCIVAFLTFILPLAFVNYYPVAYLLGKRDDLLCYMTFPVSLIVCLITVLIWKNGILKYSSAGS